MLNFNIIMGLESPGLVVLKAPKTILTRLLKMLRRPYYERHYR